MQSITPCQRTISDRFPVASFVVRVPPTRTFEIACATEPSLLRYEGRARRTPDNFYTSRSAGLLRASAGQATVLLPPEQLRRFAGRTRLYYVLGSYGARGERPMFSAPIEQSDLIPLIRIAPDFTGRTLDRSRMNRVPNARYGNPRTMLAWGGDQAAPSVEPARPETETRQAEAAAAYDDGYGADLWARDQSGHASPATSVQPPIAAEPGYEAYGSREARTPAGAHERYGSAAVARADSSVAARTRAVQEAQRAINARPIRGDAEARGFEDAPALQSSAVPQSYAGKSASAPRMPQPTKIAAAPRRSRAAQLEAAGSEPNGAEDAPHLARMGQSLSRTRFGAPGRPAGVRAPRLRAPFVPRTHTIARYGAAGNAARVLEDLPVTTSLPAPVESMWVDDAYEDENPADVLLAATPPELATTGEALSIRRKLELLVPIATLVSGPERYSAVEPDSEFDDPTHPAYRRTHHGLHFGLLGFTQRSGLLGMVLQAAQRRDAARFSELFGPASDALVRVTTAPQPEARLQPIDGAFVWQSPWLERMRAAGADPIVQAAQNEVAVERLVDMQLPFAALLGLTTDRGLAMFVDRVAQMGSTAGRGFVVDALSPIGEDEQLLAAALAAVGASDLAALQARYGLPSDGLFTSETHAALLGALRALGPSSPITLVAPELAPDHLLAAARGRRFELRVATLRNDPTYRDAAVQIG